MFTWCDIYRFKLSLTHFLFSLRMVTITLLLFDQFTNISIKMLVYIALLSKLMCVCVLTGRRFVRECIRGLKCRSVEAVHSPAHHACKPQGSALLSREREKLQPLTAALPSLSQITDSPCPSLISVFRALSLSLFCCYYHSLSFPLTLSLLPFHAFSLSVTVSHTHTYSDAFSFPFSSWLVFIFTFYWFSFFYFALFFVFCPF